MHTSIKKWVGPFLLSLIAGMLLSWLAFHSTGNDWTNVQTFGELTATSKWSSEYPTFSWFLNGGGYLLQDPQSIVTSPTLQLLTSIIGPMAGVKWTMALFAMIGCISMFFWLQKKIGRAGAVFAALAWTLSTGFFWRTIAGHCAYYIHFVFPLLLLLMDRAADTKKFYETTTATILLGLTIAWCEYEPGFHSLFYILIPGCTIYAAILLTKTKSRLHLITSFCGAIIIACALLAPKLNAWLLLPINRDPDLTDGILSFYDVLYGTFATARTALMGFHVPGTNRWHTIWEVNNALSPTASILALIGLALGLYRRNCSKHPFLFAVMCIVISFTLAGSQHVWLFIQKYTSSGIRVPSRFLGLAAFGLAILAGISIQNILSWKIKHTRLIVTALFLLQFCFVIVWFTGALKHGTISPRSSAIYEKISNKEKNQIWLNNFCPVGSGCFNTFETKRETEPYVLHIKHRAIAETWGDESLLRSISPDTEVNKSIQVEHMRITINPVPQRKTINLSLRPPLLGLRIETIPPLNPITPAVSARTENGHITLTIDTNKKPDKIIIKPIAPHSLFSVILAATTLIGCIVWLMRHYKAIFI
jgi:hypothetical protein